jgi:trimeric autotransporter adhesin
MSPFFTDNPSGFRRIILLLIACSAAVLLTAPVSANTVVTIVAHEGPLYYLGDEVVFSGVNTDSDSTYLFITGPNLAEGGAKLSSPFQNSASGDFGSFDQVQAQADHTWEYRLNTTGLGISSGTYTIYAVSQPTTKDQFGDLTTYGTTSIILKKHTGTATISPSPVLKGERFTVSGTAEDYPEAVQIWIIGDNYVYTTITPVNRDSSFFLSVDEEIAEKLPAGQNYLIVQQPLSDDRFDIVVSGDYVRNLRVGNGTDIFRINGTGSLQGKDAAEALIAAFNNPRGYDAYTEVPFRVEDPGISTTPAQPATTIPIPSQTRPAPLQYAPFGAVVLVMGIAAWKRH